MRGENKKVQMEVLLYHQADERSRLKFENSLQELHVFDNFKIFKIKMLLLDMSFPTHNSFFPEKNFSPKIVLNV